MKDSEFLELLNLYLDHEITAADAARLESEVQSSPERRRVYQQYCRMQKACTMLAKDFVDETVEADRKVVAFEQPRRSGWGAGLYAAGGLAAAAACVAIVLVNRGGDVAPTGAVQSSYAAAPAPVAAPKTGLVAQNETKVVVTPSSGGLVRDAGIARTVSMPTRRSELQPVIAARTLFLAADSAQPAATTEVPAQLEWVKGLQLAPLQQRVAAEELRFEAAAPAVNAPKSATYSSQTPPTQQGVLHMTAFQFRQ